MENFEPKFPNVLKGHIITIDGPAGAGKGTLAKSLAYHYRMKYLDTGTLYRTVAYITVELLGGNPENEADVLRAFEHLHYDFRHIGNNEFRAFLNGNDITDAIRTMEAGVNASKVSKFQSLRARLKTFQVDFATEWKDKLGVILDGQDMGTVICPNASIKLFIDASAEVRAERRHKELIARGRPDSYETILAGIKLRDNNDRNRTEAPLKPAADAVIIDTSTLNAAQVLNKAAEVIAAKGYHPAIPIQAA